MCFIPSTIDKKYFSNKILILTFKIINRYLFRRERERWGAERRKEKCEIFQVAQINELMLKKREKKVAISYLSQSKWLGYEKRIISLSVF